MMFDMERGTLGFSTNHSISIELPMLIVHFTKALIYGVRLAISRGYSDLHLESDSLVLVQVIQGKARCPWRLRGDLQELLKDRRFFREVSHCFQEANKPADRLVNIGVDSGITSMMTHFVICLAW